MSGRRDGCGRTAHDGWSVGLSAAEPRGGSGGAAEGGRNANDKYLSPVRSAETRDDYDDDGGRRNTRQSGAHGESVLQELRPRTPREQHQRHQHQRRRRRRRQLGRAVVVVVARSAHSASAGRFFRRLRRRRLIRRRAPPTPPVGRATRRHTAGGGGHGDSLAGRARVLHETPRH